MTDPRDPTPADETRTPQPLPAHGIRPAPRLRSPHVLLPLAFVALTIVAQIGYPLTTGATRDRITVTIVLSTVCAALAHATATRGVRYAVGFAVLVSGVGLLAEVIGTTTGIPFGCYAYAADRLGPALLDVPLVIALAWTGGVYPVYVVAGILSRRSMVRIALTATGAVGWDLFLDPQMVADGQWTWCTVGSGLPGVDSIPYTNYLGWFGVALVIAGLLAVWERAAPDPGPEPGSTTLAAPVTLFLWTWLGSALAHAAFLGLPASAGYGLAGMGVLGVPLLLVAARRFRSPPPAPARDPDSPAPTR
ncbi:carotenoid biosynthesis protein [Nocardia sp. CNY236]|uniref:carotenoid biosynthesis protein n=1 Tax=Nocardia sp. CNY236 TaxID=1169152 RepID=UPI00040191D3|nr:carotenoid biosynthesis protein [Nocardia sp. CNY236]